MSHPRYLGALQMAILRVLWTQGETSAAQIHHTLERDRPIERTTVATTLNRLEKGSFVRHRTVDRQYLYQAIVSEDDVRESMISNVVDLLFQGDSNALVNHLLKESQAHPEDVAEVRALVQAKQAAQAKPADEAALAEDTAQEE